MAHKTAWRPLSQDEKRLLEQDEESSSDSSSFILRNPKSRSHKPWILILVLALSASLTTHLVLYLRQRGDLDQICTRHTTLHWSPILDHKMTYSDIRFNGSLFASGIYRQPPSPEVDKKWSDLGLDYLPQVIPEHQAERAGLTLNQAKRLKSQGGGYFVEVEAIHQLHCLNVLRQNIWFNFEYYRERKAGVWANTEPVVRLHVGHCIDIIRQQLMCTADTGLFGQMWVHPDHPTPFADFSTHHKCKNYELVRDWAEKHQSSPNDMAEYQEGDLVIEKYP